VYIRWIVRKHKNAHAAHMSFHDAYLVESYRDDNGNPRQRTISYLGNIRQYGDEFPGIERELFLTRVKRILNGIQQLSEAERTHILRQLHRKVPPLTLEELREGLRNTLRWYYQWGQDHGHAPTHEEVLQLAESVGNEFTIRNGQELAS